VTHAVEDRSALVDRLAATLQARMVSGELVSGTRLRQEALAEEFGVSRTPIREALRKLQASGLVELQPNRGALVRGPSSREIRDAYEVRAELEGLAAELAAERIQHAQVDGLHEAQSEFRETLARMMRVRSDGAGVVPDEEIERWRHANDRFHLEDAGLFAIATARHLDRRGTAPSPVDGGRGPGVLGPALRMQLVESARCFVRPGFGEMRGGLARHQPTPAADCQGQGRSKVPPVAPAEN